MKYLQILIILFAVIAVIFIGRRFGGRLHNDKAEDITPPAQFMDDGALLLQGTEIGINTNDFEKELPLFKDLNIKTARIILRWAEVQPYEPGSNKYEADYNLPTGYELPDPSSLVNGYYWEKLDNIVNLAEQNKINLLINLRSVSPWGTQKGLDFSGPYLASSPPIDLDAWQKFITAVASRYKNKTISIDYEIENEINAPSFWQGTVEEYTKLLSLSYGAIKKANPGSRVLPAAVACGITKDIGGMANRNEIILNYHDNFLRKIFETKKFDVINVHNYYYPENEINGFTFSAYMERVLALAGEDGIDKPVWITEFGYPAHLVSLNKYRINGSLSGQESWFKASYALSQKTSKIFWITLHDRNEPYFGSMGINGTNNPSYNFIKKINGALAE